MTINRNLIAEKVDDVWTVRDPAGGRWWPNEEARAEIEASKFPAVRAVHIARFAPMRGIWKD